VVAIAKERLDLVQILDDDLGVLRAAGACDANKEHNPMLPAQPAVKRPCSASERATFASIQSSISCHSP
jgi:hypothetical protein